MRNVIGMQEPGARLRVMMDTNVVFAVILWTRWPYPDEWRQTPQCFDERGPV